MERDSQQYQMELVYGLSYSHNMLADANFEQFLSSLNPIKPEPSKEKFQVEEIDQSSGKQIARKDPLEDVWRHAPDVERSLAPPAANAMTFTGAAAKEYAEREVDALRAAIVNASANGACLEFPSAQHPKIVPGEIVCCRNSDDAPWQLGLVRWKRITAHLLMQLGVEFLPMTPMPRAARVLRQNKPAGPYLPALLLQPEEGESRPPQILLPVMPFKQGDRIHLLGGKRGMVATLSVPIDATSHISRFTLNDASGQ